MSRHIKSSVYVTASNSFGFRCWWMAYTYTHKQIPAGILCGMLGHPAPKLYARAIPVGNTVVVRRGMAPNPQQRKSCQAREPRAQDWLIHNMSELTQIARVRQKLKGIQCAANSKAKESRHGTCLSRKAAVTLVV